MVGVRDEAGGDPVEAGLGERAEAWRRAVMRPGAGDKPDGSSGAGRAA